jgi:hypothetical protein
LSTFVGAKGRTWWRKTMMRASSPILTEFIHRLHLYIYSGNLRCCLPFLTVHQNGMLIEVGLKECLIYASCL